MKKQKADLSDLWNDYKNTKSVWKTAANFGLCGQSVHERLKNNGYKLFGQRFTEEEDAEIIAAYKSSKNINNINLQKLADKLGRPHHTNVCRRARELGLTDRKRKSTTEQKDNASIAMLEKVKNGFGPKTYSKTKKGWAEFPNGKRYFLKSSWEFLYASYLQNLMDKNLILSWEYEIDTFWFEKIKRGVRSYTPDFKVKTLDEKIEYHEVKGWMDARSKTKLKRMRIYHPKITMVLIDKVRMKELNLI